NPGLGVRPTVSPHKVTTLTRAEWISGRKKALHPGYEPTGLRPRERKPAEFGHRARRTQAARHHLAAPGPGPSPDQIDIIGPGALLRGGGYRCGRNTDHRNPRALAPDPEQRMSVIVPVDDQLGADICERALERHSIDEAFVVRCRHGRMMNHDDAKQAF